VFALSSRTEQMPLSMLEAMASALPVASTDVGDVRIMLPEQCRGALVPAGDSRGLAAALDALARDPERRQREGRWNRAHCLEHYELGMCMQRYVDLYEQVAALRRSRVT
jgi:glycosyltransferase involved in cell wall biosynthesis